MAKRDNETPLQRLARHLRYAGKPSKKWMDTPEGKRTLATTWDLSWEEPDPANSSQFRKIYRKRSETIKTRADVDKRIKALLSWGARNFTYREMREGKEWSRGRRHWRF